MRSRARRFPITAAWALLSLAWGISLTVPGVGRGAAPSPRATGTLPFRLPTADRFGVNGQVMFWSMPGLNPSPLIGEMRRDGIQIVRADAPWQSVQPTLQDATGHQYRWGQLDAIESALAGQGERWLPVIDYSAPWAASRRLPGGAPDQFSAPTSHAQFAQYAAAVAWRYGPKGSFWRTHPAVPFLPVTAVEIWNEENTSVFWHPAPDASAYLRLYEAARGAIHGAAPGIEVLVGGLSNPASSFLDALYAAGGQRPGQFDGVAIHPYGASAIQVLRNVIPVRRTLDRHGDIDTPLDVTEVGWPTLTQPSLLGGVIGALLPVATAATNPFLTDTTRANYTVSVMQGLAGSDCAVERILPHTWVTPERDNTLAEDWYGIVHPNGVPSLTALAYSQVISHLERASVSPQPANALCGRILTLRAKPFSRRPRAHRHAHPALSRREACARVMLRSAGSPVDRANVAFTFMRKSRGARIAHRSRVTDTHGSATQCVRALAHAVAVQVSATRPDFGSVPVAHVVVRVR